jgi:hypothetical protein
MQQKAAICEICGEPIHVEFEQAPASQRSSLYAVVERAAADHLATHPTPIVEQFLLRKHLDEIAPDVRPAAVKQIYSDLVELWGDADRRGVYTIDDVLGSLDVYRLWCNANRCTFDGCRHTA